MRLTAVRSPMMAFLIRGHRDWRILPAQRLLRLTHAGTSGGQLGLRGIGPSTLIFQGNHALPRGWVIERQLPSLPPQVQAQRPATAGSDPIDQPGNAPIGFNPRVATSTRFPRPTLPNPHHRRDPGPAPGRAVPKRCTVIRPEHPTTAIRQERPTPSASWCH